MNMELPTELSLKELAPEKSASEIKRGLARTRAQIEAAREPSPGKARPRRYAPAGQSTQMVVGADTSSDLVILRTSTQLYASYALERVYYSAFSPTEHASDRLLPAAATPLMREHRLYQADWLLRFYGFALSDIEAALPDGMLDLKVDPKMAWALARRAFFPLDVNRASREQLLRIPGLGTRAVDRIITARRHGSLRLADVARLTSSIARARPFIVTPDWHPGPSLDNSALAQRLRFEPQQLSLPLA
jgi:predicted DNA-binding helix-hairpin-helix protein